MKAGLLEAADVFVVNKADRAGADALMAELRFAAHLQYTSAAGPRDIDWEIPILATEAHNDRGVAELLEAIGRHRTTLEAAGALEVRRRARRHQEFRGLLTETLTASLEQRLAAGDLASTFQQVVDGALDPYSAAEQVLAVLSWKR
jgi:LAO/AO transport system kinase